MSKPLRIALTKGRLESDSVKLFEKAGLDCENLKNKGRRLVLSVGDNLEAVLAKAADVITYVEYGVCELGIVGKDTILENSNSLYEVLDLGFGKCRFCIAALDENILNTGYDSKRIASKYPRITKNYFERRGMDIDVIKIEGSVELAPILGLADAIADIVETGTTLKENGLKIVEEICPISARLVVNTAAMKLRKREIEEFISLLENAGRV